MRIPKKFLNLEHFFILESISKHTDLLKKQRNATNVRNSIIMWIFVSYTRNVSDVIKITFPFHIPEITLQKPKMIQKLIALIDQKSIQPLQRFQNVSIQNL